MINKSFRYVCAWICRFYKQQKKCSHLIIFNHKKTIYCIFYKIYFTQRDKIVNVYLFAERELIAIRIRISINVEFFRIAFEFL